MTNLYVRKVHTWGCLQSLGNDSGVAFIDSILSDSPIDAGDRRLFSAENGDRAPDNGEKGLGKCERGDWPLWTAEKGEVPFWTVENGESVLLNPESDDGPFIDLGGEKTKGKLELDPVCCWLCWNWLEFWTSWKELFDENEPNKIFK